MNLKKNFKLTIKEIEKYDRQIRLWGLESQKLIKLSKLLFWNLQGANVEILKNCILAGVEKICIVDDSIIKPNDVEEQFYINENDIGYSKIDVAYKFFKKINQNCTFVFESSNFLCNALLPIKNYSIIILANESLYFQKYISRFCRNNKIPYFYTRSIGIYGYAFCDCLTFNTLKSNTCYYKNIDDNSKTPFTINIKSKENLNTNYTVMNWPSFEKSLKANFSLYKKKFYLMLIIQVLETLIIHNKENIKNKLKQVFNQRKMEYPSNFLNNISVRNIMKNWPKNICNTNALISSYVSNSVLSFLQCDKKRPPFQNILIFDLKYQKATHINLN